MNIKFNAAAAERLIQQMETYCQSMSKDGSDILDILDAVGEWNDVQMQAFATNITEISKGLVSALNNYSEYMELYQQRVEELRG